MRRKRTKKKLPADLCSDNEFDMDSSDLSDCATRDARKRVTFGTVTVYHCAIMIGDTPTEGPPIRIGRTLNTTVQEIHNIPLHIRRRRQRQLALSPRERVEILIEAGFSHQEIKVATLVAWEEKEKLMEAIRKRRAVRQFFSKLLVPRQDSRELDGGTRRRSFNQAARLSTLKQKTSVASAC